VWPRVLEFILGVWLVVSPFIFRHPADERALWTNDFAAGTAISILALLSYWQPFRHVRLAIIGVAGWLLWFGYQAGSQANLPAYQNHIVLGLLLLMLAILPNNINAPPKPWQERTL
jgi:hypothetical protein